MESATFFVVEEGSIGGCFSEGFSGHGGNNEAGIRVFESAVWCGENGLRRRA